MKNQLNASEVKDLEEISNKYYMNPIIHRINSLLKDSNPERHKFLFNQIYSIMRETRQEVEELTQEEKNKGKISNVDQAMKAHAGNVFQNVVIYLFLKNKEIGNIHQNIFITSKKSRIVGFNEIALIKLGDNETQKPDCDLIIYTYNKNQENQDILNKCMILSLKTSLRERAAQTYKWKLLLEIASDTTSKIKEKYNISYEANILPLIGFVTVNFYDEINNPQQRGMLTFFDKAFIAKELTEISQEMTKYPDFIQPLSDLVDFVNQEFI